jgi:hypothetical protein
MNDEFLTQFRETPRPAFAHALYKRISQEKVSLRAKLTGRLTLRNTLLVLVALILVAACAYALTAPKWIEVGKNLWVQERKSTDSIFVGSEPPSSFSALSLLSIEETATQAGYEFKVPTWVPSDFNLKGASVFDEINMAYPRVNIFWKQGESADVPWAIAFQSFYTRMWMVNEYRFVSFGMYVGRGSTKMTEVNGIPAVLIYGDWNFVPELKMPPSGNSDLLNFKWDKQAALQLLWREGEVVYRIYVLDSSASANDLIHMAESAR